VADLNELKARMDAARKSVDLLVDKEKAAAFRYAEDPATYDEWTIARAATRRAISEYEAAQTAWLEALRATLL
jgi:hypothetical protein